MDTVMGIVAGGLVFSLIVFVALVVLVVWAVRKAATTVKNGGFTAPEYRHLDRAAGTTANDIVLVLKKYVHADGVGSRAKTTINQVESATHKRDGLMALVSGKFTEGSMTWDRFAVATDSAYQAIMDNCTLLGNRIQTFDVKDYRTQARARGTGSYKRDAVPDQVQEERWNTLNIGLNEMDNLIAANEKLLLELDRFSAELGELNQAGTDERTAQMLDEIRTLTEEAKLYR